MRTLALLALLTAPCLADELHLRDGSKLTGRLVSADEKAIVFRTDAGLVRLSRDDVRSIVLDGPAETGGGLPPGVSLGPGLRAERWFTLRLITKFTKDDMGSFYGCVMSRDGSRVAFSCQKGLYTIATDGSDLRRVTEKNPEAYISISDDGRRVAWYEDSKNGFIAGFDGSGRTKLAGDFSVYWFRFAGGKVFATPYWKGGIFEVTGAEPRKVVATADVGGTDHELWMKPAGGASDDGSRLVFQYGDDAWQVQADGSQLRRLTQVDPKKDKIGRVRVSGDGRVVAIYYDNNDLGTKSRLDVRDWDGTGAAAHTHEGMARQALFQGISLQLSRDGKRAAMGPGLVLYDNATGASWNVADDELRGDELAPFYGLNTVSLTSDFRRACADIAHGFVSQIAIIDFNPASLGGLPPMGEITVAPLTMPADGSKASLATLRGTADAALYGVAPFRAGWRLRAWYYAFYGLRDKGEEGDAKAGDGIFSRDTLATWKSYDVAPGPLTLRFFSFDRSGGAFAIDVEGASVTKP